MRGERLKVLVMDYGDTIDDDIDAPVMLRVVRSLGSLLPGEPSPDDMRDLLDQIDEATATDPDPANS